MEVKSHIEDSLEEKFKLIEKERLRREHIKHKETYAKLNDCLFDTIYGLGYTAESFEIEEKIADIVIKYFSTFKLKEFINFHSYKGHPMGAPRAYDIVHEVLENMDENLAKMLDNYPTYSELDDMSYEELVEILFDENEEVTEEQFYLRYALMREYYSYKKILFTPKKYASFINLDGEEEENISRYDPYDDVINIIARRNLYDAGALIHEFAHYTNYNNAVRTNTSSYFTESFSFAFELYFMQYLEENHPEYKKESQEIAKYCAYIWYRYSLIMKTFCYLLRAKENGECINYKHIEGLKEFYDNDPYISAVIVTEVIAMCDGIYNNIHSARQYDIATAVSTIMFDQYQGKSFKNFLELNEALQDKSIEEIYKILGIVKGKKEFNEIDKEIQDSVLFDKLKEEYKKEHPGCSKIPTNEELYEMYEIKYKKKLLGSPDTSYRNVDIDFAEVEKKYVKTMNNIFGKKSKN